VIRIVNKIDLLPSSAGARPPQPDGALAISVLTGEGLEELRRIIAERIDATSNAAADEGMVVINARHERALEAASESLQASLAKLREESHYDFIASDLRVAMEAFASIGGKIDNEQVLNALFQRFCIGK
jgi:tRNA modification GTPase